MSESTAVDIHRLTALDRAVSAYHQLLSGVDTPQPETLQTIQYGLEQLDDYFVDQPVSLEALSDHLKSIGTAVKNAIRRLFEALLVLWKQANLQLVVLKKRLEALKKDAAAIEGTPRLAKIEVHGVERIAIQGKVDLHDTKPLEQLVKTADFLYTKYPDYIRYLVDKLVAIQKKHAPRYDNLQKEVDGVTPKGLLKNKVHYQESGDVLRTEIGFAEGLERDVKALGILPGNRHLQVKTEETGPKDGRYMEIRVDFNNVLISHNNTPAVMAIPVANPQALQVTIEQLYKLVVHLETSSNAERAYEKVKDHLLTAIDEMDKSVGDDTLRRGTIHHLQALSAMTVQPINRFNTYITDTLKAYVALIHRQVDLYA